MRFRFSGEYFVHTMLQAYAEQIMLQICKQLSAGPVSSGKLIDSAKKLIQLHQISPSTQPKTLVLENETAQDVEISWEQVTKALVSYMTTGRAREVLAQGAPELLKQLDCFPGAVAAPPPLSTSQVTLMPNSTHDQKESEDSDPDIDEEKRPEL